MVFETLKFTICSLNSILHSPYSPFTLVFLNYHPFTFLFSLHSLLPPFIHPFLYSFSHSSIHTPIPPFIPPSLHSSFYSFINFFISPFSQSSIHPYILPLIFSSISRNSTTTGVRHSASKMAMCKQPIPPPKILLSQTPS